MKIENCSEKLSRMGRGKRDMRNLIQVSSVFEEMMAGWQHNSRKR